MMNLLPFVGLIAGFCAVYFTKAQLPMDIASYLAIAALAGLDSVVGGIRAGAEQKFNSKILLSGFFINLIFAVGLAYLGDVIGVDLFLAVEVALGGRIFLNLSVIRRVWLLHSSEA